VDKFSNISAKVVGVSYLLYFEVNEIKIILARKLSVASICSSYQIEYNASISYRTDLFISKDVHDYSNIIDFGKKLKLNSVALVR
jgi:hypothetical protein